MDFVEIPRGILIMGDKRLRDAAPQHRVEINAFAIGKYPATNAEYAEFVNARGYETEAYWTAMGWKWLRGRLGQALAPGFWHEPRLNQARYPVVGVSWYEAVAFCNWMSETSKQGNRETGKQGNKGKEGNRSNEFIRLAEGTKGTGKQVDKETGRQFKYRLPSEAEWEYAARGAENARNFSWGEKFERGRANTAEAGFGGTTPVTHFPAGASPFGAWDMGGNVFEWTLSKWGVNWQELVYPYPYRANDGREDLEGSGARVMRGGSWFNPYQEALCAYRSRYLAGSRGSSIGFRVARVLA
ncbi:MAG: formylglycine-generating enzyme family protein [Anaerolineales bacterium]|nr:formylglycine-generating enzyme family protein [Anaerolineales bacterium]